MVDLKRF